MAADAPQGATALTLERVFGSPDLSGPVPRALKLSPDGALLTSLKARADEKDRLWATGGPGAGNPRKAHLCCYGTWEDMR